MKGLVGLVDEALVRQTLNETVAQQQADLEAAQALAKPLKKGPRRSGPVVQCSESEGSDAEGAESTGAGVPVGDEEVSGDGEAALTQKDGVLSSDEQEQGSDEDSE
jgi:hypothetical protein